MKVTESMIEAYFRDELDEYAQALVEEHFRRHPGSLEKYMTEKSWDDFEAPAELAPPIAGKMLDAVESATYRRPAIRRMVYRCTAAAAVLLVAFTGYFLLTGKTPRPTVQQTAGTAGITLQPRPDWKNTINHSGKTIKISLPDGSRVELSKGSELRYLGQLAPEKREIWLTGTALFTVEKDKKRSFTVYAEGLAVTALGTVFSISSAGVGTKRTEVHLLSGRVVVNPDSQLLKKGIDPVYLEPGQALVLDKQQHTLSLARPGSSRNMNNLPRPAARPAILEFNDEPLANMFNTLSTTFQVRLVYKNELLKGMRFTGRFDSRKETLESFLSTISVLNNLNLQHQKNTYYISQ